MITTNSLINNGNNFRRAVVPSKTFIPGLPSNEMMVFGRQFSVLGKNLGIADLSIDLNCFKVHESTDDRVNAKNHVIVNDLENTGFFIIFNGSNGSAHAIKLIIISQVYSSNNRAYIGHVKGSKV